MSTQSSSFDLGRAANILFTAGLIGCAVSLFLWLVAMPGGPGAAMQRQGSSTVMAVYAQCLYDSAFYVSWLISCAKVSDSVYRCRFSFANPRFQADQGEHTQCFVTDGSRWELKIFC